MNYLTEEGQLAAAFRRIAAHMKPESILLFDMNTEYKFREVLGRRYSVRQRKRRRISGRTITTRKRKSTNIM